MDIREMGHLLLAGTSIAFSMISIVEKKERE